MLDDERRLEDGVDLGRRVEVVPTENAPLLATGDNEPSIRHALRPVVDNSVIDGDSLKLADCSGIASADTSVMLPIEMSEDELGVAL